MLSALVLCAGLVGAPPIELGLGAGIASSARQDYYSLWSGPEPVFSARIFAAGDLFAQGMTEVALMPVVLDTGPDRPLSLQQGLVGAFTIQQTFLAGYRFHIDERWAVAPAAGIGANYQLEVSGDAGGGAPYVSGAAQLVVARQIGDGFAIEAGAVGSIGTLGSVGFIARGALTLVAMFRFE